MAIAAEQGQRVAIRNISWEEYEGILHVLGDRRLPHSYRKGTLEIMSPGADHEWLKRRIGRFIEAVAAGSGRPILGFGSTTWRRETIAVGLEPDECYYVAHELRMRAVRDIDFENDPPPDLVLEIDITSSSTMRLLVYSALGVPEIWRYKDNEISFLALDSEGQYQIGETSLAFPQVKPADVIHFLGVHGTKDEWSWIQDIIAWAQQQSKPAQ